MTLQQLCKKQNVYIMHETQIYDMLGFHANNT